MKGALLWKRILNEGLGNVGMNRPDLDMLARKVLTAPIIVDSRFRDEAAEEGTPWKWGIYKSLAVPFDHFWAEGSTLAGHLWGTLVTVHRKGKLSCLDVATFAADQLYPPCFMGGIPLILDESGSLDTRLFDAERIPVSAPTIVIQKMEATDLVTEMCTFADNLCDLLLMLGCKNVALKPNNNDPKEVRRAIKRHGGTSDKYRYHTLVVRPAGARSDAPPQDIGIMPRHICRGHFAEYGPEFGKGLLFGRYAGRFYIPPHLKGDKKNGVVEKDYAIPAMNSV